MGLARVVVLLAGLGVDARGDRESRLRTARRRVFGGAEDLGTLIGQCHGRGSPRAAHLAQHRRTGDTMEAVGVICSDPPELVASELGAASVMRQYLGVARCARQRFEGEQRVGSGRTVQVAVPTDRPVMGPLGAPVMGVQVHDQIGPKGAQRQGPVAGIRCA